MATAMQSIGLIPKMPKIGTPKVPSVPDPNSFKSKVAARKKTEEKEKTREGRKSTIKSNVNSGIYTGALLSGPRGD